MEIRKITALEDWLQVDKTLETAFLHRRDPEGSKEKRTAEEEGRQKRTEEAWALADENGKFFAAIKTTEHVITLDGKTVPCGELDLVGSLPERREGGNIRTLMGTVLGALKEKGDVFAMLHPFSYRFYRKFGFELVYSDLKQTMPTDVLSDFRCRCRVKQLESAEEVGIIRSLYEEAILRHNAILPKQDADWVYHGNGEYGSGGFWDGDLQRYTYIFYNGDDEPAAYLTFVFAPNPERFTVGTMRVNELYFKDAEALENVLGFIYSMRAKCKAVQFSFPGCPDLAYVAEEASEITRSLEANFMLRILNVGEALKALRHPDDEGSYTLKVTDAFLPENSGNYKVCYRDGEVLSVGLTEEAPDLAVTEECLCQLIMGTINLKEAALKGSTKIYKNETTLRRVFIKRQ